MIRKVTPITPAKKPAKAPLRIVFPEIRPVKKPANPNGRINSNKTDNHIGFDINGVISGSINK